VNRESAWIDGRVVIWHDDEGWGALASTGVEGEVRVHFSSIAIEGYKTLRAGQSVSFTYVTPGQDGYPHRAISVRPRGDDYPIT
jgi:CspA family cold shock protein